MSLKGHLGTIALPELLQWLAIGQKTGTLVLVEGETEHRIAVDRGRIVGTSTGDPRLQLGSWLRRAGAVDEPTLERAQKLREATGMSLGRVLLTLQALSEEQLKVALRDKAEALVSSLFHATDAGFRFVEDGDPGDYGVALSLDATQLVLSAAHSLEEASAAEGGGEVESAETLGRVAEPAGRSDLPPAEKTTATVIETLPEHAQVNRRRFRRRAVGGLAAALVAALVLILVIVRSQVPAQAEESVAGAAGALREIVPSAAADLGTAAVAADLELVVAAPPPPELPAEPPAAEQAGGAEGVAEENAPDDGRLDALLAEREAELRQELDGRYRRELAELRRQLAERRPPPAAGEPPAEPEPAETRAADKRSVAEEAAALAAVEVESPPSTELATAAAPSPLPLVPEAPRAAAEAALEVPPADTAAGEAPAVEASGPPRTPARLLSRSAPVYPHAALRLGREAAVTVRMLVAEDGTVRTAEVVGRRVGLGFDEAALAAARRSRWTPASKNGEAVSDWVELRFEFQLP